MANLRLGVHTAEGGVSGSVELPASVFDAEMSIALMHQVVVAWCTAACQGTHKAKTCGEVRGGGRKPRRQKGTGRVRQGSIHAPHWIGGGTVHGPVPRDYSQRTPKKMIAAVLRGALSDCAHHDRIHVVEELVPGQTPSAKVARTLIERLTERHSVLVVLPCEDVNSWKLVRNLPGAHILSKDQLNTYGVLKADDVIFAVQAFNDFITRTAGKEEK